MYDYLDGLLVERGAARVVLDVNGVGWDLLVPLGASLRLWSDSGPRTGDGAAVGERTRVFTHLAVREDAHTLYGFPDRDSRELFRLLLGAKGVGPGLALGVLSGLPKTELLEAVATGDVKPLVKIKGLGRKKAEQIVLDLREKATAMLAGLGGSGASASGVLTPQPPPAVGNVEDAVTALQSIGFNEKDARKSVEAAAAETGTDDLEALVRAALRK